MKDSHESRENLSIFLQAMRPQAENMNTAILSARPASVLLKAAMAASGAVMALWLTLHMVGNLTVYAGPELMNGYGEKLRATGLLWPVRVGLAVAFVVHAACAVLTTQRSWAARPRGYHSALRHRASTAAGRTMRATGFLLLSFIAVHVAQMYGLAHPQFIPGDIHHNLSYLMRVPWFFIAYLAATLLVCLHLAHGLRSSLTSLGVIPGRREALVRRALYGWAAAVTVGLALSALGPAAGWVS